MKYFSLVFITILLLSCTLTSPNKNNADILLPNSAIFLEDKGNGWIVFRFEGKKYLYHRMTKLLGNSAYASEAIVIIEE